MQCVAACCSVSNSSLAPPIGNLLAVWLGRLVELQGGPSPLPYQGVLLGLAGCGSGIVTECSQQQ